MAANSMRVDVVRMIAAAGSGHPGGSLSSVDILATLFFSGLTEYDRSDPSKHTGDRLVLSKGHAAPALYSVYHQLGWVSDEEMGALRKLGSRLQGHPDAKFLPSVEVCSGSLGQGLSIGCGLALGLKLEMAESRDAPKRVYVLCGDGEMQEGSNWEALMLAAHRRLDNLILLLDLNGLQIDGPTDEVNSLGNFVEKLHSFGWLVREVDGHDVGQLMDALVWSRALVGQPHAIVCHTIKGKGVPFMEGKVGWHGKAPTAEEAERAIDALLEEGSRFAGRCSA